MINRTKVWYSITVAGIPDCHIEFWALLCQGVAKSGATSKSLGRQMWFPNHTRDNPDK